MYWVTTVLMSIVYLFGVSMFILNTEGMKEAFNNLGFPTWLMIPLGFFEIAGVLTILFGKNIVHKNMAYGGLLLASSHGLAAHLIVADGEFVPALAAVIFTIASWLLNKRK